MAPSPSNNATLNTPGGQSQPTPSPLNINDDQAFQEKVRQLSRYIEPLRRVIQRSGSGGWYYDFSEMRSRSSRPILSLTHFFPVLDHEKTSKMKKLLEILSSSGHSAQRITMETLLKCEVVLEKMDIKVKKKEYSFGGCFK